MGRLLAVLAAVVLAAGCSGAPEETEPTTDVATTAPTETEPAPPEQQSPARVLVVTETAGFRHGSIPAAEKALRELDAAAEDYELSFVTLAGWPGALDGADAVAFVLTSGELPSTPEARAALIAFVRDGNGFLGVHSATDTFYEFPEYRDLIGTWLRDHPYTGGTLTRVVADHPATADLPESLPIEEELYRFRADPRDRGMVALLELTGVAGAPPDEYLPSAWCGRPGEGRAIYSALGHFDETWDAVWFRDHIDGAIGWAAGTRPSDACG